MRMLVVGFVSGVEHMMDAGELRVEAFLIDLLRSIAALARFGDDGDKPGGEHLLGDEVETGWKGFAYVEAIEVAPGHAVEGLAR